MRQRQGRGERGNGHDSLWQHMVQIKHRWLTGMWLTIQNPVGCVLANSLSYFFAHFWHKKCTQSFVYWGWRVTSCLMKWPKTQNVGEVGTVHWARVIVYILSSVDGTVQAFKRWPPKQKDNWTMISSSSSCKSRALTACHGRFTNPQNSFVSHFIKKL